MATLGGTPVFRAGFSVAMFAGTVLRFSSSQHAHTSVGMAPDASKVWAKEFAAATERGHTLGGQEPLPPLPFAAERARLLLDLDLTGIGRHYD